MTATTMSNVAAGDDRVNGDFMVVAVVHAFRLDVIRCNQ